MQADARTKLARVKLARARLAEAQADLVRSLVGQGPLPAGFNNSRIAAASDALLMKRARSVAHSWPVMSGALGERFYERFILYAQENPIPSKGGPLADGRLFARSLACSREFPEAARLEALAFDARHAACHSGFISRKGLSIRAALLKQPRRLIVILHHSRLGERWLKIPLSLLLSRALRACVRKRPAR